MWIEDRNYDLINLTTACKVIVKNMTTEGDTSPSWWCAAVFPHTPRPAILYIGSEENAKKARRYVKDRMGIEDQSLVVDRVVFDDDQPDDTETGTEPIPLTQLRQLVDQDSYDLVTLMREASAA